METDKGEINTEKREGKKCKEKRVEDDSELRGRKKHWE
jgi:hypothetical protein